MTCMETSSAPVVSVCIPTYNYSRYIRDAIQSVRSQTFRNLEIIVIDDCSTDNTYEKVRELMTLDDRIRYVINETRLGFAGNFARCVELATGEFVKIVCADDVIEPTCVEKMVKAMKDHDQVTLAACSRRLSDSMLQPIGESGYTTQFVVENGSEAARRCFFKGNLIGEPTAVMFRKKGAERGFNPAYSQLVDLEMWLHLLEKGDFLFVPEKLCTVRQHEGQATHDCMKTLAFVSDLDKLHREYMCKPYMRNSLLNAIRWRLSTVFVIWAQRKTATDPHLIRQSINRYMNYRIAVLIMPAYFVLTRLARFLRGGLGSRLFVPRPQPSR